MVRRATFTRLAIVAALLAAPGCAHRSPQRQGGARPQARRVPPSARRELIFSQALGGGEGPVFVVLGSGFVYRLEPDRPYVSLSPRLLNQQPPLFRSPLFGQGVMVLPAFTGDYRIDTPRNLPRDSAVVSVRIYREEYDNVELACIRDRTEDACRPLRTATGERQGLLHRPLLVLGAAAVPVILWFVGPRSGK